MTEKILVLSQNDRVLSQFPPLLKKWGVEVVDVASENTEVPFEELRYRYNIIIIDKHWNGGARGAVECIHHIRTKFQYPIIGIEVFPGGGQLFSLQVAGANFTLPDWTKARTVTSGPDMRWSFLVRDLTELITQIEPELKTQHPELLATA